MRILKKLLISAGVFLVLVVMVYFLFPGFVISTANSMARLSAGMERKEIMAADFNWVYYEGGKGATVVLLHGAGLSKDMWGEMLPELAKSFHLIVPDLPGFGESDFHENKTYSIREQAERFEEFVKALKLDSFHLVGLSLGGGISGLYSSMYPDRIKTLTLMGSYGVKPVAESDFLKVYARGENPLFFRTPAEYDLTMTYVVDKPQDIPAHFKSYLAKESSKRYDAYSAAMKNEINAQGWDMLRPHLSRIKAPSLVLWGEKDRVFDVSCAEIFRKGIWNSRVEIIRDAGHIPYFDRPEETVSAVRNFVVSQSAKQ